MSEKIIIPYALKPRKKMSYRRVVFNDWAIVVISVSTMLLTMFAITQGK